MDAGFAGDLLQRETRILARGANGVANSGVGGSGLGGEFDLVVADNTQVRRGAAGARLVILGLCGSHGLGGCRARVCFARHGNRLIRRRTGVGVVLGHAAHMSVRNGKAITEDKPIPINAHHPNKSLSR